MRATLHIKPRLEPLTAVEAFENLPEFDKASIEAAARSGDWIGKYGVTGFSPENQVWNAIEAAFEAWCASPRNSVPHQVREIFARMAKVVKPSRSGHELLRQASPEKRARIVQPAGVP